MHSEAPKYDGLEIKLGGRDFTVPPLNLKALRRLQHAFSVLDGFAGGIPTEAEQDALLDVIHAAVQRNYPRITKEELEDLIAVGDLVTLLPAIMAASGLEKRAGTGKAKGPQK